jgi:hypothetical protein
MQLYFFKPWCRPCPAPGACAGAMPPHGEASGEGAAAAVEEERRRQGASCLLVEDQANRGEVAMEALSMYPLTCLALQKLAEWLEARAFSRCPNRAACSRVRGPAAGHGGVAAERPSHVSDAWHVNTVGRAREGLGAALPASLALSSSRLQLLHAGPPASACWSLWMGWWGTTSSRLGRSAESFRWVQAGWGGGDGEDQGACPCRAPRAVAPLPSTFSCHRN